MNNSDKVSIDVAIIGGGIVGLWICYELLKQKKGANIVVFEKEDYLLEHTSGRNSEVLHAGLYYPFRSKKHDLCIEGNRLWREFIKANNLDFLDCGKYIVSSDSDDEKLNALFLQASNNEVQGLRWATSSEKKDLSEFVKVQNAFFSPSSGVLNVSQAGKFLQQKIESMGGIILTKSKISIGEKNAQGFLLHLEDGTRIQTGTLINSAGLFAIEMRKQLGLSNYKNFYVKGNYLALTRPIPAKHLIYPVPPKDKLGLGVHLTLDTNLSQKFGPNTELVSTIDYRPSENLIEEMYAPIKNLFHTVKMQDLNLAYCGIRPKVKNDKDETMEDFIIDSPIKNYIELLGIESPGLTASPAIAKMVSKML